MKGKYAQITVVSRKLGNVKLMKIDTQSATTVSSPTNDSCHSVFFIPFVTFQGNRNISTEELHQILRFNIYTIK